MLWHIAGPFPKGSHSVLEINLSKENSLTSASEAVTTNGTFETRSTWCHKGMTCTTDGTLALLYKERSAIK